MEWIAWFYCFHTNWSLRLVLILYSLLNNFLLKKEKIIIMKLKYHCISKYWVGMYKYKGIIDDDYDDREWLWWYHTNDKFVLNIVICVKGKYLVARSTLLAAIGLHVIRKWLVSRILLCLFKLLWSYWINANAIYGRRCANRFPIESSVWMVTGGGEIHGPRSWKKDTRTPKRKSLSIGGVVSKCYWCGCHVRQ